MPSTFVAFSSRSASISIARRLAAESVVKNGLPSRLRDGHAPLLEVAHRATADVVLADLVDADGRHDADEHADRLERVLQRQ